MSKCAGCAELASQCDNQHVPHSVLGWSSRSTRFRMEIRKFTWIASLGDFPQNRGNLSSSIHQGEVLFRFVASGEATRRNRARQGPHDLICDRGEVSLYILSICQWLFKDENFVRFFEGEKWCLRTMPRAGIWNFLICVFHVVSTCHAKGPGSQIGGRGDPWVLGRQAAKTMQVKATIHREISRNGPSHRVCDNLWHGGPSRCLKSLVGVHAVWATVAVNLWQEMEREQSKLRKLLLDYQKAEQLQIQDRIDRCTLSQAS